MTQHRVRMVMQKLGLKVTQRVAYKITTKSKHSDQVADNLLNKQFNPKGLNQGWGKGQGRNLPENRRRLDVSGDRHGPVLAPHCWMGDRQTHDHEPDQSCHDQSIQPQAAAEMSGVLRPRIAVHQ